jgi:tRNA (guanine-N7-)-methyltransferase
MLEETRERRIGNQEHPLIPSFARSRKRSLRQNQREVLSEDLPFRLNNLDQLSQKITGWPEIVCEIGIGSGEHLLGRAAQAPNTLFIGTEVFDASLSNALNRTKREGYNNVLLSDCDGRILLNALPNKIVSQVYILFPDPWPKARHYKRRLVNQQTLTLLAEKIRDGGELIIASDHPDYVAWAIIHIMNHPSWQWQANQPKDWRTPPKGHVATRYQEKAKAGHPRFLIAKKLSI